MGRFCHSISLIYQENQWRLAGFKTQSQSRYPINSVIVLKNTSHEPEIQPVQSLNFNTWHITINDHIQQHNSVINMQRKHVRY